MVAAQRLNLTQTDNYGLNKQKHSALSSITKKDQPHFMFQIHLDIGLHMRKRFILKFVILI